MMERFRECCFKTVPKTGRRAIWEITHKCTMNCEYCFQEKKRRDLQMRVIHDADLKKICMRLPELGVNDILITGGEIFHAKDVLSTIVDDLRRNQISISFSTAMISNKSFINLLFSHKPKSLNISLDPVSDRDKIDFNKMLENVEYILKMGEMHNVSVKITGIINKYNITNAVEYLNIIKKLIDNNSSLSSIYITNPYEIGYFASGLRANLKDLSNFTKKFKENEYNEIKLVNFTRLNKPLQYCLAGEKFIHIEPNGNVYPCHLFANYNKDIYYMGNIISDNPKEIDSKLTLFGNQTKEAIEKYKEYGKCLKCSVNTNCGGGCLAEIISAGKLIEPQLFCKDISMPKKKSDFLPSRQTHLGYSNNGSDITKEEQTQIIEHVKSNIRRMNHDLAHKYDHIECVVKLARFIARKEEANLRIVTASAYFHDFAPRQELIFEKHTEKSAEEAVRFLKKIGFPQNELQDIYACIDTSSFGSDQLGKLPFSLEAKVIRDADWLDAIGARGIARVFAFASAHGCEELGYVDFDILNPPKKRMSLVGPDPSPIYHFFSKLLWIKEKMLTTAGKEIAEIRHKRLIDFLENYRDEMSDETFLKEK